MSAEHPGPEWSKDKGIETQSRHRKKRQVLCRPLPSSSERWSG